MEKAGEDGSRKELGVVMWWKLPPFVAGRHCRRVCSSNHAPLLLFCWLERAAIAGWMDY